MELEKNAWLTQRRFLVAPATGTPETGGWSTRELRTILRGLEGINLIAADIVEVAVRPSPSGWKGRGTDVGASRPTTPTPSTQLWPPRMPCTRL